MIMPVRPVYRLYEWLWTGLDLLYPAYCGGCERRGSHWCSDCQSSVNIIRSPVCDICGCSISVAGVCSHCIVAPPKVSALRSWAIFENSVRNAIHRLKYKRDVGLGIVMSRPMIDCLILTQWMIDLVSPVPLGLARLKERGYNQAALLAKPIALALGLTYQPNALHRIRETRTQVGLALEQRRANVDGAFSSPSAIVAGKNILLIDDVTTSGATLEACAEALFESGADQVYALTLARTT